MPSLEPNADDLGSDSDRRLGRYELVRLLSEGGMGEVFMAVALGPAGFRKPVVLKKLTPKNQRRGDMVQMFLDEARLSASLWHSNIAQVFDLFEADGNLCLVMEHVPGENLRSIQARCAAENRNIPIGVACRIARELCLGLDYAHHFSDADGQSFSVVHRDVSPKNVMVAFDGTVKIIDFGIAQGRWHLEGSEQSLRGTLGYLSPEQARNEELDGRTDLFSVGIILHEMLTSQQLFTGKSQAEMLGKALNAEIASPSEKNPALPQALIAVVMKALAKNRDDRFSSGKELARAIEQAVGPDSFDQEAIKTFVRDLFPTGAEKAQAVLAGPLSGATLPRMRTTQNTTGSLLARATSEPGRDKDATMQLTPAKAAARIMVVDDSPTILTSVEQQLSEMGHRVRGFSSSEAALAQFEAVKPDLVILDVVMPGLNGFELCRKIRELRSAQYVPIVFLSGACTLEERVESLAVGGDDFLRKPVEPLELVARVKSHLHRAGVMRELARKSRGPAAL